MSVWAWAAVAGAGGLGAVLRFGLAGAIGRRTRGDFPLGTLTINLSGAFVLGLLTGVALTGGALLIAGTAGIGSYTTFSTWMLETDRLAAHGERRAATLNIVLSVVAGVAAAALGRLVGTAL